MVMILPRGRSGAQGDGLRKTERGLGLKLEQKGFTPKTVGDGKIQT